MKSGILVINKPEGISSARVVARVKQKLKAKKVGHTGTLDPFATGLLLCGVNKATRISKFFLSGDKRYDATLYLGKETDTLDCTGQVTATASKKRMSDLSEQKIENAIAAFQGEQEQNPPSFSALKHKGQPLYKLARKGIHVQKPARRIHIYDIRTRQIELPRVAISVFCSAGTYIRSLASDIGKYLGCGAHLTALCRIGSGQFNLEQSIDFNLFDTMEQKQLEEHLIPMAKALSFLPHVMIGSELIQRIGFGKPLTVDHFNEPPSFDPDISTCLVDENQRLAAIVRYNKVKQKYDYSCVFIN